MSEADTGYVEVVSALGHELRGPLTVIRGASSLLVQAFGDMPQQSVLDMLKLIEQHAEDMADLIEDLLAVCHLDAGDVQLTMQPVEVADIVEQVVASARNLAGERPILILGIGPGLKVAADPHRLAQMMRALVNNAIRYSRPDAPVEIAAKADRDRVRIEVLDRGPGISPELREAAFQRFRRLEEGGPGAGLGLYMARGLSRAMGGEMGVKARQRGGSVFWFTLSRRG